MEFADARAVEVEYPNGEKTVYPSVRVCAKALNRTAPDITYGLKRDMTACWGYRVRYCDGQPVGATSRGFIKPRPIIGYYPDGGTQRFESIRAAANDSCLAISTVKGIADGKIHFDAIDHYGVRFEWEEKGD